MPRSVRALLLAAAVVAGAAVLMTLAFVNPGTRSAMLGFIVRGLVATRGYHMVAGHITYAAQRLKIRDLTIDDDQGETFLTAPSLEIDLDPKGLLGHGDRAFGIRTIELAEPRLSLRHRSDGSWNFSLLIPHRGEPATPTSAGSPAPAWRARFVIDRGDIDVIDPQSVVQAGKAISLAGIASEVSIEQFATSRGFLRGTLRTARGSASMRAAYFEDDPLGFARATLSSTDVPIAPLFDVFVPTRAFIVEGGDAPIRLMAYALGYGPNEKPGWHISGDATIAHARLHVTPLVAAIRDVRCALHFNDGLLSMKLALGDVEGMPLRASGAVQLTGGVRIGIGIGQSGTLEKAKALFAFSAHQDVTGPFATTVRVDGAPSDIRVAGVVRSTGARYERVLLPDVRGAFYYAGGHLSIGALDLAARDARIWSQSDLDLSTSPLGMQAVVALSGPASAIPIAANILPGGVAQAIGSIAGPATSPSGLGYAQLVGTGTSVRTFVASGPDGFALGPLLYRQGGGEGFAWARRQLPSQSWEGALVASGLPVRIRAGSVGIADVLGPPLSLPSLDTTLDGEAFAFEPPAPGQPQPIAVNARASSFVYEGTELGAIHLEASGTNAYLRVGLLSVDGPALSANAAGSVSLGKSFAPTSAVFAGTARADLAELGRSFPAMRLRGSSVGDFSLAYDGAHWVGGVRATSSDASLAGVPVRSTSAVIDASSGSTAVLGDVAMPGGGVWAFGTLAGPNADSAGRLDAFIPDLDLAALAAFGLRGASGRTSGFATMSGSGSAAAIDAAAVVRGSYQSVAYAGDVDMRYGAGTLHSHGSRIALLRNQAIVDGAVSGLRTGAANDPLLALSVRIREGDLVALDRFTGTNAPLTGSYDADAAIGGDLRQPTVDARLNTDIGTIRGVAFNELRGALRVRPNDVQLSGGSVELGRSAFGLRADATPRKFSVRASSPHVDMTDFNDFFGGKDVFAGIGAFDIAVSSLEHHLLASGAASLDDAALYDYRLGHIETTFGSGRRGGLHAAVTQSGPGGSMRIAGTVGFRQYRGSLPDFATAAYRVRGHLRDLQVDEVLPFIHQENLGLSGLLNADGTMRGTLTQPAGDATFQLRDGYLKRIQIQQFSAKVTADHYGVTLTNAALALPFLSAQGSGTFGFANRTIAGNVSLANVDLHALGNALQLPGALHGSAVGRLGVSGTIAHPRAVADVDASHASFYDVAFDEAKLHAQYSPGEVSIGDTTLTFAGKRGRVDVTGTLPVQLKPLALGPKEKPVGFALSVSDMDLSALDPITKRYATLTGRLDAQATITGTAGNPVGKGKGTIANASAVSPLETVPLTGANAQLDFQNDTITLEHLHATLGSGSIDVKGAAHVVPAAGLRSYAGLQLWSRLGLHNAQVNVPNWISGTADGVLSFTRSGSVPYLAGSVGIANATIPFSAIYALAEGGAVKAAPPGPIPGVPELRPGHTIVYGGGLWGPDSHTLTTIGRPTPAPTGFSLPSLDLDVGLNANNNVRIRGGSSIDLTTTGGITIAGNLQAPTLQGQFQAIRGQVGYFDTTFRVVSGTVTFDPTSGLLPTLDATAVTNVGGAQITLTVSGRVDNLNTDLESNPSMSRDEIIATLLHAPTVAALTSANPNEAQATIVQTAQSFFNAQLSRSLLYPVESALAQELNIESISLIFNQYGALAVEVRTRFSNTVSAVYQSSVGAPIVSAYGVSYRLQDYLALDVLQTSQPDNGLYSTVFNLRYTFR